MREPTVLILAALAVGPQHGYGIMTDVAQISDGRVRLRPGDAVCRLEPTRRRGPGRGGPGLDR